MFVEEYDIEFIFMVVVECDGEEVVCFVEEEDVLIVVYFVDELLN